MEESSGSQAARAVEASPFFRSLDLDAIPHRIVQAARGEALEGEASDSVVLVCGGAFEVLSVASDGSEVLLAVLREGDCFGVNSLYLDDAGVGTKIRCLRKGTLLAARKEDVRAFMASSPKALEDYARLCDTKIHFLLERIGDLTVRSSEERLLSYLQCRAGADGTLELDRSKEALAKMLNMSRAALFSAFAGLEAKGLLCRRGRTITITNNKRADEGAKEGKI